MRELLEIILKNITTNPEDIRIEESEEEGRQVYTIFVHPEDMGRVIGKNGKVIRAIRSLAHVVAIRQGLRFRINVAETGEGRATDTETKVAPEAEPETEEAVNDDVDLISGAFEISPEAEEAEAVAEVTESEIEAETLTEVEVEEAPEPVVEKVEPETEVKEETGVKKAS